MSRKIEDMSKEEIIKALMEGLDFLPNDEIKKKTLGFAFLRMVMG